MQNCKKQEWIVEQFRMETKFASMQPIFFCQSNRLKGLSPPPGAYTAEGGREGSRRLYYLPV